jgi:hypothetical protein
LAQFFVIETETIAREKNRTIGVQTIYANVSCIISVTVTKIIMRRRQTSQYRKKSTGHCRQRGPMIQ